MAAKRRRATRIALLLALFVGLYLAGRALGLAEYLEPARIRTLVADAGAWGALLFVAVFVASVVAQIPAFMFVVLAPALFPWQHAWLLCVVASNVAVALNFELVRRIGGQPLGDVQRAWMRRAFASLDAHPIRSVALLRIVTIMFPPVTTALALTRLGARDHAVGSFLGMLLPITGLFLFGLLLLG
jgi:uncharacterized membrane protein YdjX (TVP38/TMEM64 family)